MAMTRRQVGRESAGELGLLVTGPAGMLRLATSAFATASELGGAGFGPLVPDPAGLLDLPAGFRYQIVTQAGRPLAGGSGGGVTPGRPDGTASFPGLLTKSYLVVNHEQGAFAAHPATAEARFTYDPGALGGTSTLRLDNRNRLEEQYVSLAGTMCNCSGGVTPWGTWLTCEETEARAGGVLTRDHGWVFEVSPLFPIVNRDPEPLTALGRFPHEAVVVDPLRGQLYLTEDAAEPNGLLYRFTPKAESGRIHSLRDGGTLEAMRIPGVADLSAYAEVGTTLPVTWVAVPDPLSAEESVRQQFTYRAFPGDEVVTGPGGDATRSRKFESLWWGRGKAFLVCSYARGAADWSLGAHDGQVWSYDPRQAVLRLEAWFPHSHGAGDTDGPDTDGPDNITASPWGGVLVADDAEGHQHLVAVADDGAPSPFARNALSGSELTGVNFSPDRRTLYANIQDEGYTFAVTGPFPRFRG